ncbi:MAG TPA: glycosyltransferase [Planctomycetota bacterium]|nr:glycosyltransferase [Planctomycetota bacterium]
MIYDRNADQPLFSVVVCCYQAGEKLQRCVESLLKCEGWNPQVAAPPAFQLEIILAEGGSSDDTAAVCEAIAARCPGLVHTVTGLPKSASAKRNAGAKVAHGRWLAFTDPDIVVDPKWLSTFFANFTAGEICQTGRILELHEADLQTSLRTSKERRHYAAGLWQLATAWKIGGAGNVACTREAFDKIGGFMEDVGPGTPNGVGEDPDFFYRMLKSGVKILYEPAAIVHHDHAENFTQFLNKKRGYFKGGVYFMARRAFFTPAGQLALALRFGYPFAMFWLSLVTFRFSRLRQAWHEWLGAWSGLWRALVA